MLDELINRLRRDFELAMLTLFGGSAVLGIFPFAIYRFLQGDFWIGVVDSAIVLGISSAMLHAWWTGRNRAAGIFMVVCNTLGSLTITVMFGHHGLPWVFVVVVTNFFLTERRIALAANVLLLLVVWTREGSFISSLEQMSFIVTSALVCAYTYIFAWRTASQRQRLEALASQDPLTQTGNRRLMEMELERVIGMHRRTPDAYGLAIFDLDHFKLVNDVYGHEAGDQVLISFADILRRRTRKSDRLFRMGGEEFVLLMANTTVEQMRHVLEHLHRDLQKELDGPGGPVTVSVGGAGLYAQESWQDWLARADAAMYAAKHRGRNQVVIAEDLG